MNASRFVTSLAVLAAAGVPLTLSTAPVVAQDRPPVVGTWTLNTDKTEEARDRVIEDPESTGANRPSPGRGGRGRGGGGTGGGGAATGGARGSRGAFGLIFGGMMRASQTLKILEADSVVSIDDEDGPIFLNVRTDGKTFEQEMADRTILRTKAQWRRTDLIIERSHDVQGSARMIFKIDAKDPKVMTVEFHFENKRQRRTVDQKRVYNASI